MRPSIFYYVFEVNYPDKNSNFNEEKYHFKEEEPQEEEFKTQLYREFIYDEKKNSFRSYVSDGLMQHICTLEDTEPPASIMWNQDEVVYIDETRYEPLSTNKSNDNLEIGLLDYEYFGFYEWSF